ncbi:hypothetical protein E4U42_002885 [Claviceps africana]|uniref:Uncharacterized protein n=1 Tax=Claviceps africana TaxID=83212 RepID=A0A8K0JCX5_9HYPO|nr:hypothetical protein E4U42_002885 [Claviceps africana]
MAQSQTAVLSRPKLANVSRRLAGYLPLSSTCPSLPHVQIGARPHTLSDCVQSGMQHGGRLDEEGTLIVTPGPCIPSPTTDKGKRAQTHGPMNTTSGHELTGAGADAGAGAGAGADAGGGAGASVMSFETLMPSRRFGGDDVAANNRRSTPVVDETTHHGAARIRITNATRSTEYGAMSADRNSRGTDMDGGRSHRRDAAGVNFTCASESHFPAIAAADSKHMEGLAAHVDSSSRKSLQPLRISNTIEHFEALVSGDGSDSKLKSSIRLPKHLTGSSSCHLSKLEGRPKMGTTESASRKFSNSWGPARFRKSRVPCGSDARQSKYSDEPSHRGPSLQAPADGTDERSPPAAEHWPAGFHPNDKKMSTSHVAQVQTSKARSMAGGRLRPKGPRPQPTTTTGHERTSQPAERPATETDVRADKGHGHGSWRSRRRWVSRSSIPLVAQADCALQQPKPIRVNEVRRLVSLCRDKMTARKYRAQTD